MFEAKMSEAKQTRKFGYFKAIGIYILALCLLGLTFKTEKKITKGHKSQQKIIKASR